MHRFARRMSSTIYSVLCRPKLAYVIYTSQHVTIVYNKYITSRTDYELLSFIALQLSITEAAYIIKIGIFLV
jgi:hypothetical protein